MEAPARLKNRTWPKATLIICAAAAVVFLVPSLQDAFIYDRSAIAAGQWWRLITGNLVHFSAAHFAYDVFALLVAGTLIELKRHPYLSTLSLVSAAGIGVVLFFADPDMRYYGGLSGVVTAAVVYLCLYGLRETGYWRWLCAAVLALIVVKIGAEACLTETLLGLIETQKFVPVPLSHFAGAIIAAAFFALQKTVKNQRGRVSSHQPQTSQK